MVSEKRALYNRRYYEKNRERIIAHNTQNAKPEVHRRANRKYYETHREEILEKKRKERLAIKQAQPPVPAFLEHTEEEKVEERRRRNREYYQANKERLRWKREQKKRAREAR